MTEKPSRAKSTEPSHVDLRRVNGEETRQRILDVAQELFARHGYYGVSLREITRHANVNIASVHYHLGSKEHLLLEVLRRGAAPVVEKRDAAFRNLEKPYHLEDVIRAFLEPIFGETSPKQTIFAKLRARLVFDNDELVDRLISELFDESTSKFVEALRECVPQLPEKDLFFRVHYLLGVTAYTMSGSKRSRSLSDGIYDPTEGPEALEQLITFVAAGFRAAAMAKGQTSDCDQHSDISALKTKGEARAPTARPTKTSLKTRTARAKPVR